MQVIILGPPGVGKGTQSLLIAKRLGLIHLSTGEILRNAVEHGTELGLQAKETVEAGKLVSDEVMIGIIKEALSSEEMKLKGFILDGFPRTIKQASELENIFKELEFNDVRIINIVVDENEIIKRLSGRGRTDDTADVIRHRLEVYKEQTEPVRNYFSNKYVISDIYGIGNIEEINASIIEALGGAKINVSG